MNSWIHNVIIPSVDCLSQAFQQYVFTEPLNNINCSYRNTFTESYTSVREKKGRGGRFHHDTHLERCDWG